MKNRFFIISTFIFVFLLNRLPLSFAAVNAVDPRETAIDRAIGGMEEGSRPLEPQNDAAKNQARPIPGEKLNPSMDTRATASAVGGTTGSTETVTEPTSGSTEPVTESPSGGGANDSIVNLDAGVDLSGGSPTVDANLNVDTNADSLLDANATTTTDVASTDVTAVESGIVAGQDLTTIVNEAPVDAILNTEIIATDVPTDSEATAGLEADVDPVAADSDVPLTDPADGLTATL